MFVTFQRNNFSNRSNRSIQGTKLVFDLKFDNFQSRFRTLDQYITFYSSLYPFALLLNPIWDNLEVNGCKGDDPALCQKLGN